MCLFPTARVKWTGQARRCGVGGGSSGLHWGLALHVMEMQWLLILLWTGDAGLSFYPCWRTDAVTQTTKHLKVDRMRVGKHILRNSRVLDWSLKQVIIKNSGSWIQRTLSRLCSTACGQLAANRFEGGWAGEVVSNRAAQHDGVHIHSCLPARGSLPRWV